jgi:hypothetical protein
LVAFGHVRATEVQLGGEGVVSAANNRQVCSGVCAPFAERPAMVKLEVPSLLAANAAIVHVGAARAIALVNGSAHSRWNVPPSIPLCR